MKVSTDEETGAAIQTLYQEVGYMADPHGAVGWLALSRWLKGASRTTGDISRNCPSGQVSGNRGKIYRETSKHTFSCQGTFR